MARFLRIACLVAVPLALGAPSAFASVTVGQVSPGIPISCSNSFDFAQFPSPGSIYTMPAAGTITSWTHSSQAGAGQTPTLKVFRKVAEPTTLQVVGHDGPRPIAANTVATFAANIAVQAGDTLGLTGAGGAVNIGCQFVGPGQVAFRNGNLLDGQAGDFTLAANRSLNASAVLDPTNTFTFGAIARNKKRGTATLTVNVPNPGRLSFSTKGIKGGGVISKPVSAPGPAKLKIRATGKRKRVLEQTGAVKLKLQFTFTPTGGDASTQSRKLKLKRN